MIKKNKKQPTVIILYGPPAVGKLTVGKLLAKKLGYKLAHNHALNDAVTDVFERTTNECALVLEKMRFLFLEECVHAGANLVVTHCYNHDYINKATGVTDPEYLRLLEEKLTAVGAKVHFVHLQAEVKELVKRVTGESRKAHKKLTKKSIMQEYVKGKDWTSSAPVNYQIVIDNTNLSPKKVVDTIIKEFSLK